ncbi:hypothetical protein FRC10_012218 [Ceratobasidium sp. 414]|nr:hypothetical protein FRC10_012218 [Ceratobasidium sp. 414]
MLGALVDYSDDSEAEGEAGGGLTKCPEPVAKPTKRKNSAPSHPPAGPKKSNKLNYEIAPTDDPSKHQGRTRSVPYVEGQFVGHVYVPIRLEGELLQMLREVVRCAQAVNPAWYSLLDFEEEGSSQPSKVSVHLSLSRPIPLRAHQRDDLRKEFTVLTNDDKTRTFLCAEVGAGHKQLQELSQSLSSHLASLRQLPYYPQPRFHISIAWILTPTAPPVSADITESRASPEVNRVDQFLETVASSVGQLQQTFSQQLLELGRLDARSLEVKIGKEITTPSWILFFTIIRTIMPVSLPLSVELPTGFELDKTDDYISRLLSFLTSSLVESLIFAHPNEIAVKGEWLSPDSDSTGSWWSWAGNVIPNDRRTLIDSLIDSATGRDMPAHPTLDIATPTISRGMSPKKAHEVDRLGKLIDQTFSRLQSQTKTRLIVDVGAGQGYLSYRLAATPGTRVLALDGDESQTEGAALRGQGLSHARRQQARKDGGVEQGQSQQSVTHRTLFITSDSLSRAVDEWVSGLDLDLDSGAAVDVLVTGLHACGSLTPAVLRCFVDLMQGGAGRTWRPSALALVGCCYNLMHDPNDFPLSQTTTQAATLHLSLKLTPNHLQLAAQCPAQWSRSASERERAALARCKIVWRALLARMLQARPDSASTNRLGRLPDRAYASWEVFVGMACTKMEVLPPSTGEGLGAGVETLAFQLELLHVLRALIGPVIESLIVMDRAVYLAEQVALGTKVRVVNVFDQLSSGSTRNIALVVEPNNVEAS